MKILSNFYAPCLADFDIVLFNGKRHDPDYFAQQPTMLFSQIAANLPEGWEPDVVLFHTPFYYKIPVGIEDSPWPTVAVLDDWFGGVDFMPDVLGWFDYIATDLYSIELLARRGITNTFYWPSFGHDTSRFRLLPEKRIRDIDIAFAGNLNGNIQYERFKWLRRAAEFPGRSVVGTGIFGEEYTSLLNRAKIGFNRSIKGEMNLRCFEVPACGALLFIEEDNREVRRFLEPGKECVVYNTDNLENLLEYYLSHDEEREAIAEAGREKIGQFSYEKNYERLISEIQSLNLAPGVHRRKGEFYTDSSEHLHLIQTALAGAGQDSGLLHRISHFLQSPLAGSPLFLNDSAVLLANYAENAALESSVRQTLFRQSEEIFAAALSQKPDFLTALFNRMQVKTRRGDTEGALQLADIAVHSSGDCIGLVFPLNYTFPLRYLWSQALAEPSQFSRIQLIHCFAYFTAADMHESRGELELAYEASVKAVSIYPDLSYGMRKMARIVRRIGKAELFRPYAETALDSAPFDSEVLICAVESAETELQREVLKDRAAAVLKSASPKTKAELAAVERWLDR